MRARSIVKAAPVRRVQCVERRLQEGAQHVFELRAAVAVEAQLCQQLFTALGDGARAHRKQLGQHRLLGAEVVVRGGAVDAGGLR